jgi:hypothetical protein
LLDLAEFADSSDDGQGATHDAQQPQSNMSSANKNENTSSVMGSSNM